MSLLNLHGLLLELLSRHDLVYSPLMDIKEYPGDVDIALVEGAVGNSENKEMAEIIRKRTKLVVSLGDCAVNGNVSALRNPLDVSDVLRCSYGEGKEPARGTMELLPGVMPLHQFIRVDAFIPGCPPGPSDIMKVLEQALKLV
jgi:NAD-reducing hydrogenase small subunit